MPDKPLTYEELENSLKEAEEILDTLRNHEVDAVLGTDKIAMMRLKQVEDQLQDQIKISGNRLKEIESIYQNVPIGLCILDRNLRYVRINNQLAKIHGIPAEDHINKKITEVIPALKNKVEDDLKQVVETGKAKLNVELRGETPSQPGVERRWLQHWLPLYNRQNEVIGINMVVEEITERKKYEEKLKHLNEELEERVDERTKVAEERAIKLREMALQMTQVEEEERQRLARLLHDGLQQLLIGAKFNAHFIMNEMKNENLKEQLEELHYILDQSIEASRSLSYELSPPILHDHGLIAALEWLVETRHMKGLKVKIEADKDLPELTQNLKVFLFQVIREFLFNIIKHAEADKAEVHVYSKDGNICLKVIDYGVGFDTSKIDPVNSNSQGLRNIRKKLDLMNGELIIESEPGSGSSFKLCVPIAENPDTITQEKSKEKDIKESSRIEKKSSDKEYPVPNAIKVLVVDDHQVMRNGLVRLLDKEADIDIIGEASNGVEAVNFAEEQQPEVIIMDITMPIMNGIEATRTIKEKHNHIKIIGLSMHEEGEYKTLMIRAGANDLLNKGGPSEQLFEAIRSARPMTHGG